MLGVRWKDGRELSTEEAIRVCMQYYGEDYEEARDGLWTMNLDELQRAVRWCEQNSKDRKALMRRKAVAGCLTSTRTSN